MCKWIIAVMVAALLAGGCGGGYKVNQRVLDAYETITSAAVVDYEYYDHEGVIEFSDGRRVVVGWWGGKASGYERRPDGTKTKLSDTDAAAFVAAFEIVSYNMAARFTALKN
jgi:hypothetical protein